MLSTAALRQLETKSLCLPVGFTFAKAITHNCIGSFCTAGTRFLREQLTGERIYLAQDFRGLVLEPAPCMWAEHHDGRNMGQRFFTSWLTGRRQRETGRSQGQDTPVTYSLQLDGTPKVSRTS
jgi:hypothetical protein